MLLDMIPVSHRTAFNNLDACKYKITFTKESVKKLTELLEVLSEDKQVGHLVNNVSISSRISDNSRRSRVSRYRTLQAMFSKDPSIIADNIASNDISSHPGIFPVKILNFDLSHVQKMAGILPSNTFEVCSTHQNVEMKIKIPDYFLNYNSFCRYLKRPDGSILEYVSLGPNSTLIALIISDRTLYIRWPVLKSILDKYSISRCKSVVKKIFLRYNMYLKALESLDPMSGDFLNKSLLTDLVSTKTVDNISAVKELIDSKISKFQNTSISLSFKRDVEIYSKIVDKITTKFENSIKEKIKEAYWNGIKLTSKMAVLGWNSSPRESSTRGEIWFEKDVTIIPSILIYNQKHYRIEAKDCPYKITKLFINTLGTMHADGSHPNVSSGGVCMGDLGKINFDLPEDQLKDLIDRGARLLELINYDSAYDSTQRDALIKKSKKLDIGELGQEKTKSLSEETTSIRRVVKISGDEDLDDDIYDLPDLDEEDEEDEEDTDETYLVTDGEIKDVDKLPGLKEVDWRKLSDILQRIDRLNTRESVTFTLFKEGKLELVYLFSIANTERYVSITLDTIAYNSYSPSSLIQSDFHIDYYRSKTSAPKKITLADFLSLAEFLNPSYVQAKKTPSEHYELQMKKLFAGLWNDIHIKELWNKVEQFRMTDVGAKLND